MNKTIGMIAAPAVAMTLADAALLAGVLLSLAASPAFATDLPNKGTTPYVTHFVFRPLMNVDVPGVGSVTTLEAVGTTENLKGEKMLDKMSARCQALSVDSGAKKYIDGACVLADADGDKIFSTFDTRDLDKSQPDLSCGTHIITGGTGKYAGITGSEPFACNSMPALAGGGGYTAMDIPHNTYWEIKNRVPSLAQSGPILAALPLVGMLSQHASLFRPGTADA